MMEQKELVSKISWVHEELRKKRRENVDKDWNSVWKEHTENLSCLQEYAESMHKLATEIWDPRNNSSDSECSIKQSLKSLSDREESNQVSNSKPVKLKCRLEWVHFKCLEHFFHAQVLENVKEEEKLELLDVGSCYNPFKKFDKYYNITAVDLCPAPGFEKEILKYDFLQLNLNDLENQVDDEECNRLVQLAIRESFDIVVFSFFLEYLPDQSQRLESCRKARELLKPGGVLFILRPDSKHDGPSGNSGLIKGLKVGNAILGLKRIYFEKLEHLWCMGFVKMKENEKVEFLASKRFLKDLKIVSKKFGDVKEDENFKKLFSISQDFRKEVEICRNEDKVQVQPELFNELPEFYFDSDCD